MSLGTVSVIVPVYNSEKYLRECIDSAISQSYDDFEVIIVDDGSTDKSAEIIQQFRCDKIRTYRQTNGGAAKARNFGASKANGEWLAFLDSDDVWLPDKLTIQLNECGEKVWSHTDSDYIGNLYEPNTRSSDLCPKHGGSIMPKLVIENFIGTSSVMIKKDVFTEFGGFSTALTSLEDWDLWLRIAAKYEICYTSKVLDHYRVHTESLTRSTRKTMPQHIELINRIFADDGVAYQLRSLKTESLVKSYQINSYVSEQEGDFGFALYCALKAVLTQPLQIRLYSRLFKLPVKTLLSYLGIATPG